MSGEIERNRQTHTHTQRKRTRKHAHRTQERRGARARAEPPKGRPSPARPCHKPASPPVFTCRQPFILHEHLLVHFARAPTDIGFDTRRLSSRRDGRRTKTNTLFLFCFVVEGTGAAFRLFFCQGRLCVLCFRFKCSCMFFSRGLELTFIDLYFIVVLFHICIFPFFVCVLYLRYI